MILWMDGLDDLNGAEDVLFNDDAQSYSQGEHPNRHGRANGAISPAVNMSTDQFYLDLFPAGSGIVEGGFAFWRRRTAASQDSNRGLYFCDAAGGSHFRCDWSMLNGKTLRVHNAADTLLDSAPWSVYEWEHWEIQFKIHDTNGYIVVRRNKVEVINETGVDTLGSGAAEFCRLIYNTQSGGSYGTELFDDIVAYDFAAPDQGWLGFHNIEPMGVDGAGASADFGLYPDSGEVNYENIDETVPDKDTTYNVSGVSTDLDDVTLEDYAGGANIIAICSSVDAIQESAGATQLKVGVITEGVTTDDGTFDVSDTSYKRKCHVIHQNPDDSQPWDPTDLDGLKLKYEIA